MEGSGKVSVGLADYRIDPDKDFSVPGFDDASGMRQYYLNAGREDRFEKKYEIVDEMLDFYSELTGKVRKKEHVRYQRKDVQKELPVPLEDIYRYCIESENPSEPPSKLIVKIADTDYKPLKVLLENPRRVLRRDQQLVPVGRLQQIDSYCLRWLSKQPGRTADEKAGSRQKLMGVVRYETLDTLENRVLKQYMRYCLSEGKRYLRKYEKFEGRERYKLVQQFVSLVLYGLSLPEFKEVRALREIPRPNYAVQNNPLYRGIWQNYLLLSRHVTELELLWKNRHRMFYEVAKLLTFAVTDHSMQDKHLVHEVWLHQYPLEDGRFCHSPDFAYFDYDSENSLSVRVADSKGSIELAWVKDKEARKAVSFSCWFIPEGKVEAYSDERMLVYAEDRMSARSQHMRIVGLSEGSSIVQDIFQVIEGWCEEFPG